MPGLTALAQSPMPEMSPPPPIGTTKASHSGQSSSTSTATVAWPAITSGSLYGST